MQMVERENGFKAVCPHDCPDACVMNVEIEQGKVIKVFGDKEHAPTAGALCTKVSRYPQRIHHPQRLMFPMQRVGEKGAGQFKRITWEVAFDLIAKKLMDIVQRNPQAILPYSYSGTLGLIQGGSVADRFFHFLGASRLDRTICAAAGSAALTYTYGANVGMHMEYCHESEVIVLWGTNPIVSSVHFWNKVQQAKRQGAYVITIDPFRTLTAEKSHLHVAIRPGTDAALALAMMYVLIQEEYLDQAYIDQYTLGFEDLKQRALCYPPEKAAQICGIEVKQIIDLARIYASTKKAAIRINYGMQRVRGGGNAVRAIAALPALTGAWRERAGGLLLSSSGWYPIDYHYLSRPDLMLKRNQEESRVINMNQLGVALNHQGDAVFGPKVEALIVFNSNPLVVAPDANAVEQGLKREDLFTVVLEHFQTDTADYADLVLPATMQLEHFDIHKSYGHTYLMLNQPCLERQGECKPNTEIFREIARHMKITHPALFESDEQIAEQAVLWRDSRLRHTDWTKLKEKSWIQLNLPQAPFAQGHFLTRSGKCEFYSQALSELGRDPVANYLPPYESKEFAPALAAKFPLTLISPPARHFMNSTFANIESLCDNAPYLFLHPEDAFERGIQQATWVRVFNDRGEVYLQVRVTDGIKKGVVMQYSNWWKKLTSQALLLNRLTSQSLTDLGGAATFYDCLVQVEACESSPVFVE